MTLRVAHIIGGLSIGGAERHLVGLLNAMDCDFRAAVFISAARSRSGPVFYDDLDPAIEQRFIRVRRRSLPVGFTRLVLALGRMKLDVVHTHMFASNLYGALAAKLAGVPVVITTEHGENPWKGPVARWQERRLITPCTDLRFCVSPRILELRRDIDRIPAAKLTLTVNGTVVPPFRVRETQNAVPIIGAVGRFIPAKDYPCLLEAAAELVRRGRRFELFILGDGPEMPRVRALVEALKLAETVRLPGMVTAMSQWYERFDIYVSSSMREGQPVALLEAMAHALPVVATDAGASRETVGDGEGGLIVPARDASALADAIETLLQDTRRREELGRSARARVERSYSVAAVASSHLACYRDLLSQKTRQLSG